jgi:hypothetical protein
MQPFDGTQLIDIVIIATLLEWAALSLLRHRRQRGQPQLAIAGTLLPGLCLMLAVRSAMQGLPWYAVASLLSAAGLAHLIDIRRRWTPQSEPEPNQLMQNEPKQNMKEL